MGDLALGRDSAAVTGVVPNIAITLEALHRPRGRPGGKNGDALHDEATSRGRLWALCGDGAVHCHGDLGDSGWGCGYRNIQMLCGFLLACGPPYEMAYRKALFRNPVHDLEIGPEDLLNIPCLPSVPRLQEWLEQAWAAGFDPAGAEQLEGTVTHSKKLIGATECAALLRSFGVRAYVITFRSPLVPPEVMESRQQQAALDACQKGSGKKPKQPRFVPPHDPCLELASFC